MERGTYYIKSIDIFVLWLGIKLLTYNSGIISYTSAAEVISLHSTYNTCHFVTMAESKCIFIIANKYQGEKV